MTKEKDTIWSFFINRRPVTWLLTIGIIFMGAFATTTIPLEIQPDINIPFGTVVTFLPGANPTDVETLVTDPLEQAIGSIENIKTLTSSSGLGISTIAIEFEADIDLDKAIQNLKDKIDTAKSKLPEDATDPLVNKAEANASAIINYSIIGDRPLHELTKIAEDIANEIEKISGISKVEIAGGQKKDVIVKVDMLKAESYGLRIEQIASAIKFADFNIPVGLISTDKLNYSVRVDNKYKNLDEIRNLPIFRTPDENSTPILIKDIATVEETLQDRSVISKLSISGEPSRETVSISVFKKSGNNVIEMVDITKETIEELKGTVIPDDVEIAATSDYSEFIRTDLGILITNGIQTTILIIVVLFLALGLTEGILAGLSIPLTLLTTIIIIKAAGMTINSLTLFSLVIALGLMVDTAIVIMEGIHENLRKGLTAKQAAIQSVELYKWPLIAGTLTTVFAFFPMLLVSGILGEFLKALPITISAALLSSLFISLTVIPSITAKFKNKSTTKESKTILEPMFYRMQTGFQSFTQKVLERRFVRVLIILLSIILFVGSMALPISGKLSVQMFPKTDFRFFIISIETPKGLILSETEKITKEIEAELLKIAEVESFLTIIGTGDSQVQTDIVSSVGGGSSNKANITVNLIAKEEREKKSYEIAEELRETLKKFTKTDIFVQELTEGPPSDAPIVLRITGKDLDTLRKISGDVEEIIASVPGTENVKSNLEPGLSEFRYTLDRDKLSYYGLSGAEVASTIRNIVQGVSAIEIKKDDEDLNVIVKYNLPIVRSTAAISVDTIDNFEISTPNGGSINLGELGDFKLEQGLESINHEDQKRIIKVRSDVSGNSNAVVITQEIQKKLDEYEIPGAYNIAFGGDTQSINESFDDLFASMIIGIILIGFTLVLMFNSLKQPFIILLTLPLSLIGVFPGLMIMGLDLSFPAFLGVVALAGVVVNDAIVLIDRINQNRKNGMEFKLSIAEATNARLQPIIMTSVTTIVGITPLAFTNEFWSGLGFSLVFGLATATILTLIVIPTIYYMFEERGSRKVVDQG